MNNFFLTLIMVWGDRIISDKIKQARISAGLSRKEVAKKIGIPYTTYTNYETGYRAPRLDMVQKIARALDVSIDELLGETMYIDTAKKTSFLLSSGKATPENLVEKFMECYSNTSADELLRVQQYADKLRDYEKDARHEQAVNLLLALPEEQREAVYTIIKAMSRKE